MYKEILKNISGVEIYPEISLIIFFVFFLAIVGWSLTLSKKYISRMENIPLEEDNITREENNINAGGVK
jgi:cell division septal protein FtsQ